MSYTHAFQSTPRKQHEADALIHEVSRHDRAFILTGDLNATPESSTLQSLTRRLHNLGPGLEQKTWTTKPFSYQGFEETELNWRLDYILGTPDIRPISADILQTPYSDHLPILAKVAIGES